MTEQAEDLLGLSDRELKERAPRATYQHFKGGLYRLWGSVRDADTGEVIRGRDGTPRVLYEHLYPHDPGFWMRNGLDFHQTVEREGYKGPRFRRLG